jgi:hypothetical protein
MKKISPWDEWLKKVLADPGKYGTTVYGVRDKMQSIIDYLMSCNYLGADKIEVT